MTPTRWSGRADPTRASAPRRRPRRGSSPLELCRARQLKTPTNLGRASHHSAQYSTAHDARLRQSALCGAPHNFEIGAAWKRLSKEDSVHHFVKLDDRPSTDLRPPRRCRRQSRARLLALSHNAAAPPAPRFKRGPCVHVASPPSLFLPGWFLSTCRSTSDALAVDNGGSTSDAKSAPASSPPRSLRSTIANASALFKSTPSVRESVLRVQPK
jgi:hypothetical protein